MRLNEIKQKSDYELTLALLAQKGDVMHIHMCPWCRTRSVTVTVSLHSKSVFGATICCKDFPFFWHFKLINHVKGVLQYFSPWALFVCVCVCVCILCDFLSCFGTPCWHSEHRVVKPMFLQIGLDYISLKCCCGSSVWMYNLLYHMMALCSGVTVQWKPLWLLHRRLQQKKCMVLNWTVTCYMDFDWVLWEQRAKCFVKFLRQ